MYNPEIEISMNQEVLEPEGEESIEWSVTLEGPSKMRTALPSTGDVHVLHDEKLSHSFHPLNFENIIFIKSLHYHLGYFMKECCSSSYLSPPSVSRASLARSLSCSQSGYLVYYRIVTGLFIILHNVPHYKT